MQCREHPACSNFSLREISRRTDSSQIFQFKGKMLLELWGGGWRQAKNYGGVAGDKQKHSEKCSEKQRITDVFAEIAERTANVAESRSPKNSMYIKVQHCTVIQSRMPTSWSCKPDQFAYVISETDLKERISSSTRSSAPLLPPTSSLFLGRGQRRSILQSFREMGVGTRFWWSAKGSARCLRSTPHGSPWSSAYLGGKEGCFCQEKRRSRVACDEAFLQRASLNDMCLTACAGQSLLVFAASPRLLGGGGVGAVFI